TFHVKFTVGSGWGSWTSTQLPAVTIQGESGCCGVEVSRCSSTGAVRVTGFPVQPAVKASTARVGRPWASSKPYHDSVVSCF
ncbi:MAG: hypothetical protein ACKOX4_10825, partial [Bacteroidota bacterium]